MPHDPGVIYRSCDPNAPLEPDDPRYVRLSEARGERKGGWRRKLAEDLRNAGVAETFLVSGFSGDGKSTELLHLRKELTTEDPKMAVVLVDSSEYMNPYGYSFDELLLSIIGETGRQLRAAPYKIELKPTRLKRFLQGMKAAMLSKVELKELSGKVGTKGVGADFEVAAKIALKSRDSDEVRKRLWEELGGDRTVLVEEFARTLNEARPALKKKGFTDLVIVVDCLEKLRAYSSPTSGPVNMQKRLFLNDAALFRRIGTHLVLTLPVDLAFSEVLKDLTMAYARPPVLIGEICVPGFFPLPQRQCSIDALCEVIRRRLENAPEGSIPFSAVFPDQGLAEELIAFSGGHLRALLVLLRECISYSESLPITRAAVEAAKKDEVLAASRKVKESWFAKLATVERTHQVLNDDEHLEMLRNLCIFAYRDGETLYAVDPPILPLSKMELALKAYDNQSQSNAGSGP